MKAVPRVLCLLAPDFEEIEAVTPIDLLRRAGAEVVVASLERASAVRGRSGISVIPDAVLEEVEGGCFDLLVIPGGPGVKALRTDGRAAHMARRFLEEGRGVGAICAAPTVLHDARLLEGRRFTAHFSVRNELPDALGDERVVVDGDLITSRGAGTALEFGLELVRALFGPDKAAEVSRAVMAE